MSVRFSVEPEWRSFLVEYGPPIRRPILACSDVSDELQPELSKSPTANWSVSSVARDAAGQTMCAQAAVLGREREVLHLFSATVLR